MPKVKVQLPKELGGTVTINIREGESPQDAIDRRLADIGSHQVTAEDVDGTFLEGMGAGFTNTARQLGNMAQLDQLGADWFSDEAIEEQKETDKYLTWGHGGGGKLTGELAASLPLGAGLGKGALTASTALRAGGRTPQLLGKALGSRPGRVAVEGAGIGSLYAGPENRGGGAALGAGLGVGANRLGRAVGGLAGRWRPAQRSPEAVRLGHRARQAGEREAFIPISQASEESLVKNIYQSFIANMPGAANVLRGQFDDAVANVRRYAAEHAMPDSPEAHTLVNLTGKETVEQLMDKLNRYWDQAFDVVKPFQYRITAQIDPKIPGWLRDMLGKEVRSGLAIPTRGKTVSGKSLMELRTALGAVANKLGPQDAAIARATREKINDIIRWNLNPSGNSRGAAAQALRQFEDAMEAYPHWRAFNKAVDAAKKKAGEFKPGDLSAAAYTGAGRSTKTPLQRTGDLATKALEDFPSRNSIYQTIAAVATGTTVAGAVMGSAPVMLLAPAVMGLARLGASKGMQRYLMGITKRQRLNRSLMNKYKKELEDLGFTGRQALVMLGVKDGS